MHPGGMRLRGRFSTSIKTPMALGFGEGAEIRTPMALAVIGGLVASTGLTLVVIPVVYQLVDVFQARLLGRSETRDERAAPLPEGEVV